MKYIVTVVHNGEKWPLRGTVWAFSMDRASTYDSVEDAQAALDKAKQFMKRAIWKKAVIEPDTRTPNELAKEAP